ncbi:MULTISPECIES: ADP-forming succinate--CoA ligase subunit beta [Halorubrum]|jgi:succinyl-CoA synthetase beta subunit|uniref:Succinate--CoA ligase [ADP-forming] subunit beta n=1 Tax=Halorubrum tropicale TaxID=1765655 RepID=A0A0M9AS59_9EURY|nr:MULTISPECIES: ADP-forming succinate--CoA ligase subunit beta [Halorubrum]KOX97178.1 succinyl-CoA synthetase subunit beta [Halorubrum tropicale]RLM51720.1 ADP-forming succinate--CoA ligase subunit beta [Halorubrum sp. Atlit-28R]TKX42487.1 ADP-forming succinate--CoA ligase subunit beta [Halorubrum sp. ARQ200]TKX49876.1 ADP-forming succinate--CoA ligase subunit beta [Halorubrum sp. ASP121]TKX60884.1 ADP-forming succinate--CoA ligase subunit beta [Halorubrum sp. ASP1]
MKLHEYQAKSLFADAGIPVPDSRLATSVEDALDAVDEIGYPAAIKAQVHVGGRGKAGGIKIATDREEAEQYADEILGMDLKGYTVDQVLVEAGVDFVDELYVGVTMDRGEGKPVLMVSTEGGVNIEEVAEENPDAIAREHVDPAFGLHPYQARKVVYEAGVDADVALDVASILSTLYELYEENDASEIEVNPVMITSDRDVIAADAVMNIDEDALFRQPDLADMAEESYEDDLERKAGEYGFDYVRLSGNVGIIGNGAGLVMTTLDLVDYYGGAPANFLDIGGGAKAERVANALDMVFSDDNVDAVVFNIFGGITRGDEVAKGINEALEQFDEIPKKVVVRLAGTNAEEGMEILNTDLVEVEKTLEDAVQRAVANAEEVTQ